MSTTPPVVNRATKSPKPQPKPPQGPFRIIQRAIFALQGKLDELDLMRTSMNLRLDRIEGLARAGIDKKSAKAAKPLPVAAPPLKTVMSVGPEEIGADGKMVRRFTFANATFYVPVCPPPVSPALDDERDPIDLDPASEFKLEATVADEEPK
jgi:hypothetical protein